MLVFIDIFKLGTILAIVWVSLPTRWRRKRPGISESGKDAESPPARTLNRSPFLSYGGCRKAKCGGTNLVRGCLSGANLWQSTVWLDRRGSQYPRNKHCRNICGKAWVAGASSGLPILYTRHLLTRCPRLQASSGSHMQAQPLRLSTLAGLRV